MEKMPLALRKHSVILSLSMLAISTASPSLALDAYSQGCQSYKHGDYNTALNFFLKAAVAYPRSPIVHYQLANTYLQLFKRAQAKEEYSRCLSLNPPETTADYCHKMLDALGRRQSSQSQSASETDAAQAAGSGAKTNNHEDDSPQAKAKLELAHRKQQILDKAQAEASAIRAEADKRIKEISQNSNQVVRDPQTGEVSTGITSAQASEIRDEAEARATKIVDEAKDKAAHIR